MDKKKKKKPENPIALNGRKVDFTVCQSLSAVRKGRLPGYLSEPGYDFSKCTEDELALVVMRNRIKTPKEIIDEFYFILDTLEMFDLVSEDYLNLWRMNCKRWSVDDSVVLAEDAEQDSVPGL